MTEQDIINRLFAINKELMEKVSDLEQTVKDCNEEIERLDSENDKLDNENDKLRAEAVDADCLGEELNGAKAELDNTLDNIADLVWRIEAKKFGIIRTETTIEEVLEELKSLEVA